VPGTEDVCTGERGGWWGKRERERGGGGSEPGPGHRSPALGTKIKHSTGARYAHARGHEGVHRGIFQNIMENDGLSVCSLVLLLNHQIKNFLASIKTEMSTQINNTRLSTNYTLSTPEKEKTGYRENRNAAKRPL
jgi:hypothetical protein